LLISVFILDSLNNEFHATTRLSLITFPTSKGCCFFFLAKISVILYEAMVAALALLKWAWKILLDAIVNYVANPQGSFTYLAVEGTFICAVF
jgi:hypothetical protein